MYVEGTKLKVGVRIKLGDQVFEPGLCAEIIGNVEKMVGKAYILKFEDGREAQIHGVIIKNQTQVIESGK